MKQYEYDVITNSKYLNSEFLSGRGKQGWELVSHAFMSNVTIPHVYTFKREAVKVEEESYERYKESLQVLSKKKEERELIEKILADRSNANGHDKEGNPKYIYDGYEYVLNTSCNKVLSMSFERKFKLDDSFKKRLEEVVVSDTPAYSWMDEYRREYDAALTSGMFFEWFPTFTGVWDEDKYAFCHDRKYKKLSPQDPAIDNILEIEEGEKSPETLAYEKGWMDGYDEGLYDGQYK